MTIDGRYYTEPELAAKFREMQETIDRYEVENRKLTEEKEELGGLYNDASLGIGYLEQRCEELEKDNLNLESRCADLQLAYNNEMADLKIAKRLLKSAVNVLKTFIPCDEDYCRECQNKALNNNTCDYDDHFIWMHLNEALELIGGEGE